MNSSNQSNLLSSFAWYTTMSINSTDVKYCFTWYVSTSSNFNNETV